MSVRNRYVVAAGVVLVVMSLIAAAVVRRHLRGAERERAGEALSAASEAVRQGFEQRHERLVGQAALIAEVLPLPDALGAGDRGGAVDLLERFSARHPDLSFVLVADAAGDTVARAGRYGAAAPLAPIGAHAFAAGPTRGMTVVDGRLAMFAGRQVRDPVSGAVIAGLVLGEVIEPAGAELLSRLTNTEVVLLADRSPVVSTLPLGVTPETERLARRGTRSDGASEAAAWPRVVELGGRTYLARLEAIADHGSAAAVPGTAAGLLLLRDLDAGAPLAGTLARDLALAALLGLSLAAALVWLGSRRLNRALQDLAGAMSHTASTGRLVPDFLEELDQRWSGTEVEELRAAVSDLMNAVEESFRDRERSYVEAIGAVVAAIDARDHETTGHSFRVAHYALALARDQGIDGEELRAIEWGSLLHDVGKIAVPDAILRKTGRLTEDEWHVMRQHPSWGFEMLADVKFLEPALGIVYSHHERWDGGGYPRGLRGEEIPLAARIFAVVDTYDSITSDRPYRRARGHGEAITELCRVAGTQLDPEVVEGFMRLPEVEIRRLRERSERLDLQIRIPDALSELRVVGESGA